MEHIRQVSEQSTYSVRDVAKTAESLRSTAEALQRLTAQFSLDAAQTRVYSSLSANPPAPVKLLL
jgi:hypothetical protein